ncbi:MAG: PAS domain S-box protein, partial [Nitrospinota bacterium]|nr:PAS domain S-box protein [Nitrospinota bacterium]
RLDSAQARLKALAEAAFEGILVCDNGLVIDANDPFIKSFEYDSLQELKGKHVLELVAEEYRPMVAEKIETEASAPYEIEALTNNGNRLHVEIHSKPLPYMDRHVRVSAVRDITERRKAEQQARRRQKLQTGLADARGALIGVEDPIPAFRRIISSLGSAMEADRAYIFQNIPSGPDEADVVSLLVERVEDGIEPYIGHPIYQSFKPRPASALFSSLGRYESYKGVVSGMEEQERGIFAARGVASVIIVPIVVSGALWGGMGFEDCRRPREWTPEEESAMWAIGYNLGMFLERQRSDEERRKLTDAIGQLDEMVVITDLQGRIEYANPAVSAVTGYTLEELTGSNPRLLKSGKHGPEFYTNIWKTLGQGAIWRGRIINKRKNGQLYDEEMTISPMKNSSGQITHYAAIKRDVTKKARAEQELREAKERAEEATIMKDKFISLVAHDLRSPLASVMGFLSVADNNMDEERKKQVFHRVGAILSGMINMIDDLLDITMLQSGKIKPRLEPLDARAMADLIINEHGDAAGGKGINVVNQIPPGFLIQGDRRLIHEVLRNLFTNAVKFTGQGGLVRFDATDGAIHRIAVKDTGQGIGPELLRELFNGDVKTTTLGTAGEKGSGLGLPLCQEIMKAHGGRIGVNTSPGQGSEFFVILPNSQPAGG